MSGRGVVADLGSLDGDVLLFGGCYSNLQATAALLEEAERRGIGASRMICTGDVAGYCADPGAVIGLIRASGCAVIAGNVERQIAAGAEGCGCGFAEGSTCDRLSAGWYAHAMAATGREDRAWMDGLPDMIVFSHHGRRCCVLHGGASDIARFVWPGAAPDVFQAEIAAAEAITGPLDTIIAGHCGIAFERALPRHNWINAGAIGLPPHDGRAMTRFALLGARGVRFERLPYDAVAAADAMVRAGLTQGYEIALQTGIWPSEEVLPPEMRRG